MYLPFFTEFIIADLALSSHSILSLTLTSSNLLSSVFEAYPHSTIICHAFLLPRVLEIVYDSSSRQKAEHTIIVLGEPTTQAMASVASNIKIYRFDEVEREGFKRVRALSPVPSSSLFFASYLLYE